jgi:hypothetical protein
MPYEVRKAEEGSGYEVINSDTREVKAKHASKEDAEKQVRLLEAIEHDPGWE